MMKLTIKRYEYAEEYTEETEFIEDEIDLANLIEEVMGEDIADMYRDKLYIIQGLKDKYWDDKNYYVSEIDRLQNILIGEKQRRLDIMKESLKQIRALNAEINNKCKE